MVTPLHMEILLHHHVSSNPFPRDTQTIREYRQFWVECECLILSGPDRYETTSKGYAWLERALSTPMPVCKWVFEDEED